MTMESEYIEKLKKMLEEGKIDQKTFDEITERWGGENQSSKENTEKEESGEGRTRSGRVRISGSGRLSDVYSEELSISGAATVDGFVDANTIHISGSGHINGDVKSSDEISVSGSAKISGNIDGNDIDSSGSLKAGSIKCKTLNISGGLEVKEAIKADDMKISGGVTTKEIDAKIQKLSGYIEAETIKGEEIQIAGKIRVNAVSCKRFDMELYGQSSRIKTLEADAIEIKYGHGRLFDRFFSRQVEISEIHCKRASLEGVTSRSVVGDEIFVGSGCEIDYAEARSIKITDGGVVKDKKIVS